MAYPHNKMILSGSLPGGERWSCGVAYDKPAGLADPLTSYNSLLSWIEDDIIPALDKTEINALKALLSSQGRIDTVRTEYREGTELVQAAQVELGSPVAGTGTMTKVFQTAVVCSLLTGRPGRSYRGRVYWPALGAVINQTTGRLQTPSAQGVADAMAFLLTDVGDLSLEADLRPGVYSAVKDEFTYVNSISVGDVLDTQRRRRDTLVEARSSATIATA